MAELSNRIVAQRRILEVVNGHDWRGEELFGLSSPAIDRWASANRLLPDSKVVGLVRRASERLLFLANRSQEEISEAYLVLCEEVDEITRGLEAEMRSISLAPIRSE